MSKKTRNRTRSERQQTAPASKTTMSPTSAAAPMSLSRNWVLGLVLGVTFLAFANTIFNGFAYDDNTQILQNHVIQSFSNIDTALTKELWYWRVLQDQDPNKPEGPTTPYYRPVFALYMMLTWSMFGATPAGWHLLNILIHLLVVYFGFLILEKVTRDVRVTAIAMTLFAIHPLRSESVAWISGITDPLLAVFLLPSFYLYMRYRESFNKNYLAGSLGLYLIAAFAKEPAVALPIFIVAYELLIINQDKSLKERIKPAALFCALFLMLSLTYFVMRYHALGFVLSDNKYTNYPMHEVLLTIPLVIWKYIGLLFWPLNLSIFHNTPMVESPLSLRFIMPLLALLALAVLLWPLRKSTPARFALLWFFIHLIPVLNLGTFAEDFLVQERYIYISSIGFSLLLALGLARLPVEDWLAFKNRRTAQLALVVIITLLLSGKTVAQNRVWKDDETLWNHGAKVAADQPMSYFILFRHYFKLQNMAKVVESLEEYMKLEPNNIYAIANLAAAHMLEFDRTRDRAHVDRAIALCERGLIMDDQLAELWDTLGRAYTADTELRNYARAHAFFDRGLKIRPQNAMLHFHKGATYVRENNAKLALYHLEQAVSLEPRLPDPYKFLAFIYKNQGRLRDAADYFARYLELQPNAIDAPRISQELEAVRADLRKQVPRS